MISTIFHEGRMTYGSRRIKKQLVKQDVIASRRRIIRLMLESGLICKTKRKFKVTTDSKHNKPVSPNLLQRQFNAAAPNRYWVGDISVPCKAA